MRPATIWILAMLLIASPGCARPAAVAPEPQPGREMAAPPLDEPILLEEGP